MKKNKLTNKFILIVVLCIFSLYSCTSCQRKNDKPSKREEPHRIVNIINFIRLLEPRDPEITEDVLYQTVVRQVEIMEKYKLRGTFLLQYDALLDARYQNLLKSLPDSSFEIGAWWEIPQPLVENAGMKWRGRYPWDWHADVGFSTGYTPAEREKLVDVYMADFKKVFGRYPQSVGSWFIDAHTLNYMYQKYGIVSSCNCKDQIGTDGYTLWGGYWNQAYYPSTKNAYMPAQNKENQIPVPIFRMLGSDPVRQYDSGIGETHQSVISLEPVYPDAGGDSTWVNWFFNEFVNGESMEFAYTQTGQENSFIWKTVEEGFKIQMPLIAQLRAQGKVKVETLAESGKWFKENYTVTPATSVTINEDLGDSDVKTVWYNSRFYRANLFWENGSFRFRDIHLFDENFPSKYLTETVKSNECYFFTFPFVDGHVWSSSNKTAGLILKASIKSEEVTLEGGEPVITNPEEGRLHISWPLKTMNGTFVADLTEQQIEMKIEGNTTIDWFWELEVKENANLPFQQMTSSQIDCKFDGMNYAINATEGLFAKLNEEMIFKIYPQQNRVVLNLSNQKGIAPAK